MYKPLSMPCVGIGEMNPDLTPDHPDPPSLGEGECRDLFKRLFPQGLAGADVRDELVPEGWDSSPFLAVFHPSVDQIWQRSLMIHENLKKLGQALKSKKSGSPPPPPSPTREEIVAQWTDHPVDELSEVIDLMGRCVWDVFSDNHSVVAEDGRVVDLGTFRASAGFIADLVSAESSTFSGDYMNYYMGSSGLHYLASMEPVYRLIFRRLKNAQCDWRYSFPRIHLISFDAPLIDAAQPAEYSPSGAFEREAKKAEAEAEHARLAAEMDKIDAEARADARSQPPPETVAAYMDVFGRWPTGWPP
jgi:hypothetical protein